MDAIIEIGENRKIDKHRNTLKIISTVIPNIVIILFCFIGDTSARWCIDRMVAFYNCFLPILLIFVNTVISLYIFSTLRRTTRSFDADYLLTIGFIALSNIVIILTLCGYRTTTFCHPELEIKDYFKWIGVVAMIVFVKQLYNIKMLINKL